ncbi:hypothetical protein PAMA_009772 [Pampus argenteus]
MLYVSPVTHLQKTLVSERLSRSSLSADNPPNRPGGGGDGEVNDAYAQHLAFTAKTLSVRKPSCQSSGPPFRLSVAHGGNPAADKYETKTPLDGSWTSSDQQIGNSAVQNKKKKKKKKRRMRMRDPKDNTGAIWHIAAHGGRHALIRPRALMPDWPSCGSHGRAMSPSLSVTGGAKQSSQVHRPQPTPCHCPRCHNPPPTHTSMHKIRLKHEEKRDHRAEKDESSRGHKEDRVKSEM